MFCKVLIITNQVATQVIHLSSAPRPKKRKSPPSLSFQTQKATAKQSPCPDWGTFNDENVGRIGNPPYCWCLFLEQIAFGIGQMQSP